MGRRASGGFDRTKDNKRYMGISARFSAIPSRLGLQDALHRLVTDQGSV